MLKSPSSLLLLCVLSLTGATWAQMFPATATAPAMPKAEPVIKHIPAGTMGFVLVNNVKDSAARVEKFLGDVGLAPMLGLQEFPGGLIGMLRTAAMLGEGFNPNGGFAAVLLDPQQFGVDLLELMGMSDRARPPATAPAEQREKPKVPFILLVPGTGVREVFGNYPIQQVGKFHHVSLRMGSVFAIKCGDYVALSPTSKALTAMLETPGKASQELSSSQAAAMERSDIAMYVNMKIAGPIYAKFLKQIEGQMATATQMGVSSIPFSGLVSPYMSIYREMVSQIDSVTITGQFAPTGLVLGEYVRLNPQSEWGKAFAACKPPKGKLLDKLPNLPYVLALGSGWSNGTEESKKLALDFTTRMLASEAMAAVTEETKAEVKKLVGEFYDQISSVQLVAGGAPEGSGVFGLACVMKCKQADTVRKMLADSTAVTETMINALCSKDIENARQLKITYTKDAGKIGQIPFDTCDISHPKIEEMSESDWENLAKILGEDRIRVRVAAIDSKTIVSTIGGSEAMLRESIKAAMKGGTILQSAGIAEAMKYLPANSMTLVLLNGSNLLEVISRGMQVINPEAEPFPFRIPSKTPISIGMSVSGSEMVAVLYVPNSLIKDVAAMIPMLMGMGAPGPTTRGAEDF